MLTPHLPFPQLTVSHLVRCLPNNSKPVVPSQSSQHGVVAGSGSVSLVNSNGQVVKRVTVSGDVTQTVVSLAGLNSGVYVVRFDNGKGQVETLKVVKQ